MKIVVDTNVLVAASFWHGDSEKVFDLVEDGMIELFLSEEILNEFSDVLEYEELKLKVELRGLICKRDMKKLQSLANMVKPTIKLCVVDDPDDNKILECAIAGNVDFIVTYDKQLLKLKEFRGIKIVKPEEFLKRIK